jgi:hypothetical protein
MGKAKTSKRGNASSTPYDRPAKKNAAANNVFKFTYVGSKESYDGFRIIGNRKTDLLPCIEKTWVNIFSEIQA